MNARVLGDAKIGQAPVLVAVLGVGIHRAFHLSQKRKERSRQRSPRRQRRRASHRLVPGVQLGELPLKLMIHGATIAADGPGMNGIDDARQSPARLSALEPVRRQTARCPLDRLPVALKQPRRRVCAYEVFRQFFLQCCCRRIEIAGATDRPGAGATHIARVGTGTQPTRSSGGHQ